MIEAKLISADKEQFEFVVVDNIIHLCKPESVEDILKANDKARKVEEISIDGITHLGRSYSSEDIKTKFNVKYDVIIDCPYTSSNHALIYPPDKSYSSFTIEDLNSKNGTFVNGKKIPAVDRITLDSGATIRIGFVDLKLIYSG